MTKCLLNYVTKKQFVEADAYKAGDSIDKLLRGFIPV